jgi:hypothetical protein
MSVALPQAASDLFDAGHYGSAYLIRFDLPGLTVGYVNGPRPVTFNGLTYQPNRYLSPVGGDSTLGFSVPTKTVEFSNVPTANNDDAIATIESYDYQNAPVIISTLIVDPETGEVAGVAESARYEIASVEYLEGSADENGERTLTLSISLDPPGRAARERTSVRRALAEQQFDNDPNDTGLRYVGTNGEWTERWGRV